MPAPSSLSRVWFLDPTELMDTRLFEGIGEIGGGETVAEEFRESAAARTAGVVRRGKVVVDVGFTVGGEEEEPVLFDLSAGVGWVAGELCQCGIGL